MMTASDLIAFERDIADEFNRGAIRAPVHLAGGNEQQLIDYFQQNYDAARGDWIFSNWRSHYHCLLVGIPPSRLRADILAGRSITLTYPDHRIFSSAIVGGALPIALGVALAIKRQGGVGRVHAFCGDMTMHTGVFWECLNYTHGHRLPIHFICEDNGKSVMTPTEKVWGNNNLEVAVDSFYDEYVTSYVYELSWPHSGTGKHVIFF